MSDTPDRSLPTALQEQVVRLGAEGYAALEAGDFVKARQVLLDAFELLPEPKYEWAVGEPLLADAAYAAILEGNAKVALDILRDGLEAPVMNSPKINLRIGQAFFELDEKGKAAGHFLFALLGGGKALFLEEGPEYYAFACEALNPPTDCPSWDKYEPPEQWPPEDVSRWFELKLRDPDHPDSAQHRALTPLGRIVLVGLLALGVLWLSFR